MQTLARLFGQSPFAPLQSHMEVVAECVHYLQEAFACLQQGHYDKIEVITKNISHKEYQADCIKNDMRNHMPSGLFMPVSRGALLEIISIQDSIADAAEDVAILLSVRRLKLYEEMQEMFFLFLQKNLETFELTMTMIREFNKLLEGSFGGRKADKVRFLVGRIAKSEHECDVLQRKLMQIFFSDQFDICYKESLLWIQVTKRTAGISDSSEKLAHRIHMTLEE